VPALEHRDLYRRLAVPGVRLLVGVESHDMSSLRLFAAVLFAVLAAEVVIIALAVAARLEVK
jgi:hypothetical protein